MEPKNKKVKKVDSDKKKPVKKETEKDRQEQDKKIGLPDIDFKKTLGCG